MHGRVHQDLLVEEERRARLDEEPEGEARGGTEPRQPAPAARRERHLPPHDALAPGAEPRDVGEPTRRPETPAVLQPEEAKPVVEGPARPPPGEEGAPGRRRAIERLEGERVRREPPLPVGELDGDERGLGRVDRVGQGDGDLELPDGQVGQHARDDDQGEEHGAEEVREVVARVHRGDAEPDRREDAPPAVAGRPDGLRPPPPPAPQAPRQPDHATPWAKPRRAPRPPVSGGPGRPARSCGSPPPPRPLPRRPRSRPGGRDARGRAPPGA